MASRRTAGGSRTTTPMLEFTAATDFNYRQHNTGPTAAQSGQAGERYFTTSQQFADQALAPNPGQFRILDRTARLRCQPPDRWRSTRYRGKRVLFLLPSQALGNNVATLLFLHAFAEQCGPAEIGVFCARSTADIYLSTGQATVYPIWLGRRELRRWHILIDLDQLAARRDIEIWPVDMEGDLLAAFELQPSRRFSVEARPLPEHRRLKLGILPLASSPLRSLPPATTVALADRLAPLGDVVVCLNRGQRQGVLHHRAVDGKLPGGARVVDQFQSIGDLLDAIAGFDYAVFADSGPAHMSKLFATPGVAVYSSAPGDVLQGRFRNLANWTVSWKGPYCEAPCGLAKLRQTADGRIGCMGSLEITLDELPTTPKDHDPVAVERLMRTPVPCIAALAEQSGNLVDFVLADIRDRQLRSNHLAP